MGDRQPQAASPQGHVVVERHWKYAPPPKVMYEALVNDHSRWLTPAPGDMAAAIAAAHPATAVVFQPWVDPIISAVELRITPSDDTGSTLAVLAYSEQQDLADEVRRVVRHRLGAFFGAALREWVDQPHQ